jgi:hypothetical protein
VDEGKDPREVRAKCKLSMKQGEQSRCDKICSSVRLGEQYLLDRKDKWSDRHLQDHMRLAEPGGRVALKGKRLIVPGPLASLMVLRLSELNKETVDAWLAVEVKSRPARARLAFSLLKAFITWSQEQVDYEGLASPEVCTNKRIREFTQAQSDG